MKSIDELKKELTIIEKDINSYDEEDLFFLEELTEEIQQFKLLVKQDNQKGANNSFGLVLLYFGDCLTDLAEIMDEDKERIELLNKAVKTYKHSLNFNDELSDTYYNLGSVIIDVAELSEEKEAEKLLKEAIKHLEKSIELDDSYPDVFYNLGIAYYDLSKLIGDKAKLLNEAIKNYKKSVAIDKEYSDAYYNIAVSLSEFEVSNKGKELEDLLKEELTYYDKAIETDEFNFDAFHGKGKTLVTLAELKSGKEKDELLKQAEKCVETAQNIEADYENFEDDEE